MIPALKHLCLVLPLAILSACVDTSSLEADMDALELRLSALEDGVAATNANAIALGKFLRGGDLLIVGKEQTELGYVFSLSDGTSVTVTFGADLPTIIPVIGIDMEGRWTLSLDGGTTFTPIPDATPVDGHDGATPQVRVGASGCWEISLDGGTHWMQVLDALGHPISAMDGASVAGTSSVFADVTYDAPTSSVTFTLRDGRTFTVPVLDSFYLKVRNFQDGQVIRLGETLTFGVERSDVAGAMVQAPQGWTVILTDEELSITAPADGDEVLVSIDIILVSGKGYLRHVVLPFAFRPVPVSDYTDCRQWNDFIDRSEDNVLLDFSYAGYDHGESVPADALELGWKVYDVTDYGAVPDDGQSDHEAVWKAYQAAIGEGKVQNPDARAVLYFPEGEFILHTAGDDVDGTSSSLLMRAGRFVVKGAGRDKTTLVMQDPNQPASTALYSSPVMLELKHFSGLSELTKVTGDAAKGAFSVEVASTAGIAPGDWVCLHVVNNDAAFIAEELAPYMAESTMTNLTGTGVQVYDYHQVKSVVGQTVTFVEPILHAVAARWGWTLQKYPHYEQVGVEDLTFRGYAKDHFIHHGSWQDDGAYKPLAMTRITDGWLRRVRFTSVSEACTITNSAGISVYDIEIDGNRGHSSIRSQQSSRVFIGKVYDHSDGDLVGSGTYAKGVGQYHAVGVSKPSIGTVLWRNVWGSDACFEAHATQPRATLLDCCEGGWVQFRQGGDAAQVPNHLADLTIWNFRATTAWPGTWDWWKSNSVWWKFLPPVIIGFHGEPCSFLESQVKVNAYQGTAVEPESLYEAQLRLRLGAVPAWLNSLK